MDDLPPLNYSLVDIDSYLDYQWYANEATDSKRVISLSTSRGCRYSCGFCYNQAFQKMVWRTQSIPKIIGALKDAIDRLGADAVTWREDNFFMSKKRIKELCETIISEKIKLKWVSNCRADIFSACEDDFLKLLKESGCKTICIGAESGSQHILNLINKKITLSQIRECKYRAVKHGINICWLFMVGLPEETIKDTIATFKLIDELNKNINKSYTGHYSLHFYVPYPGTALFQRSIEAGFTPPGKFEDWQDISQIELMSWVSKKHALFIKRKKDVILERNAFFVKRKKDIIRNGFCYIYDIIDKLPFSNRLLDYYIQFLKTLERKGYILSRCKPLN